MKPIFKNIVVFFIILLLARAEIIQLKSWNFQIQGNSNSYTATIPSTFAQDLMKSGLVSADPYYRDNILQFYQYQTKNVNYTTYFTAPDNARGSAISQLVFEGLDTHCDVFLNDVKILSAHNMFRRYVLNITNLVQRNTLVVAFYSSANYDIQMAKKFYEEYDFNLPANYSFTRKAAYQYGWDWGPRILTVGIWKQCYIDFSLPVSINFLIPRLTRPIEQKYPKQIMFQIRYNLSQLRTDVAYNISYTIQRQTESIRILDRLYFPHDSSVYRIYPYSLRSGGNVNNASKYIWWTWDLGEPNYFNLTLDLLEDTSQGRRFSKTIKTSFKTVKVMQDQDSMGKQFTVNLNGFDLYIRGGNYIPPEMSMANIKPETYTKIKQYALFAKYNMIRVWGGGQFQNDEFYSAMDDAGILIWHDLMFACAMYPVTSAGDQLQNIRKQMEDNLYRIGYHPSIGIWNGNNQVWIGWQQWGWKNGLNNLQIYEAQLMYKKIFHQILPEVVNYITPDIFYWETSPSSSSNQVSTITSGDIHFWRVWGAGTPIQQYEQYIGRFNSQYGMQSMPQYSSIIKFTSQGDRVINSFVLRLHERHPSGDKYLPMYTQNYAGVTQNLKRYAYFTQVMQAYALQTAIVSLRGNKPYNMGSIYWQLNDVWPVSSWSTVDYYGRYKISHYRIRQLHNQLLVHLVHVPKTNNSQQIYKAFVVNEFDKKISLFTIIKIMDFNGTILNSYQIQKTVSPFQNLILMRINVTSFRSNRTFININSKNPATGESFENNYYFYAPRSRLILNPNLQVTPMTNSIKIKANNLANYVWIRSKNEAEGINFEKNYFDLIPGQQIIVNLPISSLSVEVTSYQNEVLLGRQDEMLQKLEKLRSETQ